MWQDSSNQQGSPAVGNPRPLHPHDRPSHAIGGGQTSEVASCTHNRNKSQKVFLNNNNSKGTDQTNGRRSLASWPGTRQET